MPKAADLAGTWVISESMAKTSPELSCEDVGVVTLDQTAFGELRFIGSCRGEAGRTQNQDRDHMTMVITEGRSVEFGLEIPFNWTPTLCTYRGTLEGSPVSSASGSVSCENGVEGTWTAAKGELAAQPLPYFASVDVGDMTGCALALDGQLFCWGHNAFGQLATGDTRPTLVPVQSARGFTFSKVSVSTGGAFACGISIPGKAYCWGNRWGGRMGDGIEGTDWAIETSPVAVAGDHVFIDIAVGGDHVCGVSKDGTAYCWGYNSFGQLGTGDYDARLLPTPVSGDIRFKSIAAHQIVTCAVAVSGDAYCWGGSGWSGVHGDGTTDDSNVPTLVKGGLSFSSISLSLWNACGVTTGSEAYCWGSNWSGELGIGTEGGDILEPTRVVGDHAWKSVTASIALSCGVTTDGSGYCWGGDSFGERGDGPDACCDVQPEPVPLHGNLSFEMIDSDWVSCGVAGGNVYCWGIGTAGGLGNGKLEDCNNAPEPVAGS